MVAIGLQETSPGQEVPTGLFKLALETIASYLLCKSWFYLIELYQIWDISMIRTNFHLYIIYIRTLANWFI